ncbi:MAG: ATP-binding protein [Acidobacteriota bacterium]
MVNPDQFHILNALPENEFFSRESDVQRLFHLALDTRRALAPTGFLGGRRRTGKTEVLKQLYNRLFWQQESIVPFFFALQDRPASMDGFCREYFLGTLLQLLAFLKKDPLLLMAEGSNPNRILQLAYESRLPWLEEATDHFQAYLKEGDLSGLAQHAVGFPAAAAIKTGFRSFVIVDDFHLIGRFPLQEMELAGRCFLRAFQSRESPHLLSGDSRTVFQRLFPSTELAGIVQFLTLRPMTPAEAGILFQGLCARFEVVCESDLSSVVARQLDCNPFYIRTVVQAAVLESGSLQTLRQFADLYVDQVRRGTLHLYFNSLLQAPELNSFDQLKAVELLKFCTQSPLDRSTFQHLQSRERFESVDYERILKVLDRSMFIDYDLGAVNVISDTVLRDWVEWNYLHRVKGITAQEASFAVMSGLLQRGGAILQGDPYQQRLAKIRQVLSSMDCQSVPTVLFDYPSLAVAREEQPRKDRVLPEILAVFERLDGEARGLKEPEPILLARGFEGGVYAAENAVTWLACLCGQREPVGLKEIESFHQRSQRLIRELALSRIQLWMVAVERFNQAAISYATEHQILLSNLSQLEALAKLLLSPSLQEPESIPGKAGTYELSLPLAEDSELIAVRGFEQLAENMAFDDKARGQIRLALMEACVNAKELAARTQGKVHLSCETGEDRLSTRVFVEGARPVAQGASVENPWRLKLLENLMDEVAVSHTHHGLELVMTKYLRSAKGEAV